MDIPHILTLFRSRNIQAVVNIKINISKCNFAFMKEFAAKKILRFFSQNEHTTQHKNF